MRDLELPEDLRADFILSRDLFSVGFDEMGLFAAGRGIEGVLRVIARRRKLTLKVKEKSEPLADTPLYDLCEGLGRVKFVSGAPLIDKETKSLLQFVRTVRNATAHPGDREAQAARELTGVIARTAERLWRNCKGARFAKIELIKNW